MLNNTKILPIVAFETLVLLATACSSLESEAESLSVEHDAVQTQLREYVRALQARDSHALAEVMSTELLDRIDARDTGASLATELQLFAAHEGAKLIRELAVTGWGEPSEDIGAALSVRKIAVLDDSVVAATVALNGTIIPKPIYLTFEDGAYRVNVTSPASGATVSEKANDYDYYRVANRDPMTRSFTCTRSKKYDIAPRQQLRARCWSKNCGFWFDGTRFTVGGASADCDYNTWGVDMEIVNGYPRCTDPC